MSGPDEPRPDARLAGTADSAPELRLPVRPDAMTATDYDLLLDLARKVVRRRMAVPAIFFLESAKPLNYVGAQAMVFFGPFVRVFFESPNYYRYTELFEDRPTVELLLRMIEGLESEEQQREKAARAARRARRGDRRFRWRFWRRRP
ncbi:MAG: hypothetical protein JW819_02665 [Candidatus Krumholzibacteriota bacterium]|nr:hypothetical protein [Candidatus Krumholzibacteriota bacterium]